MKRHQRIIHVIGLNTFNFKDLSSNIQNLFIKNKNIVVPESYRNEIEKWISEDFIRDKELFVSKSNIKLISWLKSLDNDIVIISRGDPLWFGIGRILLDNFLKEELLFYPSKTCVQLAFSKLKKPWQDNKTVSIHGRDSNELINCLKQKLKSIAILTDPKNESLELIRKNLAELKIENYYDFWLLEDIGSEKEKISLILNDENLPKDISALNLVILLKKDISNFKEPIPLFGINDYFFKTYDDRPNLLTKRETRVQILADLELPEYGTLLDIGSGSGSIGLEAIRLRPKLKLTCIDKRFGSKFLVKENAKRLGVSPTNIFEGNINQFLTNDLNDTLSASNRIILGGCDKETKIKVIEALSRFLNRGDILVLPIITYEVLQKVSDCLRQLDYETNINLIQTYKGLSISEGTRFEPNNPVFIIKAKKI